MGTVKLQPDFRRGKVTVHNRDLRPTECQGCAIYFSGPIAAEARMIGMREGTTAAYNFVNEKLADIHMES